MTIHSLPSDRDATGRDLGDREIEYLAEAVRSGHLNSTGGTFVPRLEAAFAQRHGVAHAIACASGSAAVHCALGAIGVRAGDEIVTTPITDMGAILPIVYEGAVPVFADVEPETGNVTAETIEAVLTPNTKAIIATHLFGQPCDMRPIVELARARGIAVIEDAAQAFLATDGDRLAGTIGDIACFSFQQGKHMTTGEGGIVITDDDRLADGVQRFANKGWGYGDAAPDHDRPGLNYRLTELQAAVGLAQLEKLDSVVDRRRRAAARLTEQISDLPGVSLPRARPGSEHSYWRYVLRIDASAIDGGAVAFGAHLTDVGIHNAPRYIKKPAFDCAIFRDAEPVGAFSRVFADPDSRAPDTDSHPGAYAAIDRCLVLPWNEHYSDADVDFIAESIRAAHAATVQEDVIRAE